MLDAARAIAEFVRGKGFKDYLNDRMLRGAVERHLEILGEAARRISSEFREANSAIPWKPIIAQRNVLSHEYADVRHERIWAVCTERIPELIELLESTGASSDE
jgi:uncharacterized protein with HEPN domain